MSKHIRRGVVVPDFQSDKGKFFLSESLPAIRKAIEDNRARQWRHVSKLPF
jgi:hypothetical protein